MAPDFIASTAFSIAAERGHHHHRRMRVLTANQRQQLKPIHGREAQIGDHHDRRGRPVSAPPPPTRFVHVVARRHQVAARSRGAAFLRLRRPVFVFSWFAGARDSVDGRYTRKMLPFPGSLSTAILPPCSSTIFETMARPESDAFGLGGEEGVENALAVLAGRCPRRGRSRRYLGDRRQRAAS